MSTELSFSLFGDGGFINPTGWGRISPDMPAGRAGTLFYNQSTGRFSRKQNSDFDGGWRWFDAYEVQALTIYNRRLDPRAYFHLPLRDVVETRLEPETLLKWAQCMVIVEHNYYSAKNWLEDHIRALALKAGIDIIKEIRGDDKRTHIRSVR